MKKTQFKKVLSIVLTTIILATAFSCVAGASSEFSYDERNDRAFISNEYVEYCIVTNRNGGIGLYSIGTTGGNPSISSDDNKYLLFEHGNATTSYATIVVDGDAFFGDHLWGEDFTATQSYNSATGAHTTTYQFNSIEVKQIFTIVDNNSTGRKDVVEVKYVVTNKDRVAHDIGFRIMFDTMLADNDDAPFRVPGTGDVITETEYEGDDVPQYWQAFDSLTDPTTIAQGTFIRAGYRAPDKVQFASWEGVVSTPWNYEVTPGMENGDSAVTVIWNEKALAAGSSETYVTYYGLSELQQVSKELSLSLYTDASIDVVNGEYTPNPTVATAYVKNVSDYEVDNVVIRLDAESPLSVDSASITIGSLAPGEEKQISWDLDIADSSVAVTADVTATLSGTDVETLTATRTVAIPALEDEVIDEPVEDEEEEPVKKSFFQKILDFFRKIFALIGLS